MKRCLIFSLMFCCCLHTLFQHLLLPFILEKNIHSFRSRVNPEGINHRDEEGRTLLHYAAESDADEIVVWLIDHGADVKSRDNRGESAYDIAVRLDRHESMIALILYQAMQRSHHRS